MRLENARLIHPYTEQRIRSFHIGNRNALVVIENSDAMPVAMIARMGRAAAGQVVEQIEQRVKDRRTPGIQGRLGNREINATTAQAIVRALANGISGPGAQQQNMLNRSPGAINEPIGAPGQPAGSIAETAFGHGPIGAGTSFQLNRQTGREGSVAFWSRSATTSFNGTDGGMSLNGDVDTRMFGADYARNSWILGVAVGNSHGVGDYRGEGAGRLESSVRGFYPWVGYRPTERISVWAVSGYGTGHIRLQAERGTPIETPMSMAMVASGARGQLTSPRPDGFSLAFKTDSLWVGTNTHAVSGQSGRLAAANASVSRVRTGIEATRPTRLGEHTTLVSNLELALRHDMGDAETGTGMDVGAGITLADQRTSLSINVQMRTLMVHQVEDFQERGFAVSISYDPTPGTPTGLMATVSPTWGGDATMNGQALWNQSASQMTPMDPTSNGSGINSEIGYGLPVGRRLVGTPTMGIRQSVYGRVYHLGYNLATLTHEGLSLQAEIDAQRRQIRGLDGIDHSIGARTTIGW